jgi:hypothetical protein
VAQIEVSSVRSKPEDNGSHGVELSDGSVAIIPEHQIPAVIKALQWGLAQRVFAQSQQFAQPTDAGLALQEFQLVDVRTATRGRSISLACNLSEYGWVSLLSEDEVLRDMKDRIDQILLQRSASPRTN